MAPVEDHYYAYYVKQAGGEIGPIYTASYRIQRGRGIGSFLAGLWRFARPLIFSGLKAVGKEATSAGASALADLGTKPVREILRNRLSEAKDNLKRKATEKLKSMSGEGLRIPKRARLKKIKTSGRKKKRHSVRKSTGKKIGIVRDIFST